MYYIERVPRTDTATNCNLVCTHLDEVLMLSLTPIITTQVQFKSHVSVQRSFSLIRMSRLSELTQDIKEWFADGGIQLDQPSMLKAASIFAGLFLVLAGIVGSSAIILGGGFSYFVGSIYAIIFGVLVQVILHASTLSRCISAICSQT